MARKKRRTPKRARKPTGKAPAAAPAPASRRDLRVASLLLAIAAFALYANTIPNDYALDDAIVITENRFTQAGISGIGDLLRHDGIIGFSGDVTGQVGRYRPLSLVTFAIEQELFGGNAHVGHAVNALLYSLCVVLVYRLLAALLPGAPPRAWWRSAPFLAALLFAAHPVHTEVVANIKGRDDLLSLTGALACVWLVVRSSREPSRARLVASTAVFFLALLAKENAITFLAVVPLTVWFFRASELALLRRWMPMLVGAALLFVAIRQSIVVPSAATDELLNDNFLGASLADRYATAFYTLALYLKLLLVPHPLTFDYYPYHVPILCWSDWQPWLGLVLYGGLASIALAGLRRRSVVAYGIGFYLATLSITSNLVFSIRIFMAERFLFTPSVGACLIAGWGLAEGSGRLFGNARVQAVAIALAMAVVLTPFAALTVARNRVWHDNFTLTTTDVETSADSALANATAAQNLLFAARDARDAARRQEYETRAFAHLERALEIYPRYQWVLRALVNESTRRGEIDRALEYQQRLYEIDPSVAYNIGTFLLVHRPSRAAEAARYLEEAVARDPANADAIGNLATAYFHRGDLRRAAETVERAVTLRPGDPDLLLNLAKLYHALGDDRFETARARAESLGAVFEPLDGFESRAEPGSRR